MSTFKFLFIVYANGAYKLITLCAPLSPLKIFLWNNFRLAQTYRSYKDSMKFL